jgi:hypothetical protein
MTVEAATPELLRKTLEGAGLSHPVVSAVLANATFTSEGTDSRDVRNLVVENKDGEVNVTSRRLRNLKVNWKGVLRSIAPAAALGALAAYTHDYSGPAGEAIRAVFEIGDLRDIEITGLDAQVVLFLWCERGMERETPIEDIADRLKVGEDELDLSLRKLQGMQAIAESEDGKRVLKTETFVFKA